VRTRREDVGTGSEIDWSGSSNSRIGRNRSRDWNSVRIIHYRSETKSKVGAEIVPILHFGVCIEGGNGIVCLDDGILDSIHILKSEGLRKDLGTEREQVVVGKSRILRRGKAIAQGPFGVRVTHNAFNVVTRVRIP
jgi:hypothetical protein